MLKLVIANNNLNDFNIKVLFWIYEYKISFYWTFFIETNNPINMFDCNPTSCDRLQKSYKSTALIRYSFFKIVIRVKNVIVL